ncbi:MAG: hypothetical protein HY744_27575 [Deltaproteobacteria bacterium]|nr:hypothetical protein [Deltaproteobacteria bacterium]
MSERGALSELFQHVGLPPQPEDGPRAGDVVADWLDRAADAAERWAILARREAASDATQHEVAQAAYDLLAAWTGLDRVKPDLAGDFAAVAQRVQAAVDAGADELARCALQVPDPDGWLEAARALESAVEGAPAQGEKLASLALELYDQLDEAELVACAIERIDAEAGEELHERLLPCARWMAAHYDLFLPVASYARALAEALRPDLEEADPSLGLTVLKAAGVLDALADLCRVVELDAAPAMSREEAVALFDTLREERASLLDGLKAAIEGLTGELRSAVMRPLAIPAFAPVAATGTAGQADEGALVEWAGVEGGWSALVRLPPAGSASDDATVAVRVDGAPAEARLVLSGIARALSPQGAYPSACFTLGEIRRVGTAEDMPALALVLPDGEVQVGQRLHSEAMALGKEHTPEAAARAALLCAWMRGALAVLKRVPSRVIQSFGDFAEQLQELGQRLGLEGEVCCIPAGAGGATSQGVAVTCPVGKVRVTFDAKQNQYELRLSPAAAGGELLLERPSGLAAAGLELRVALRRDELEQLDPEAWVLRHTPGTGSAS